MSWILHLAFTRRVGHHRDLRRSALAANVSCRSATSPSSAMSCRREPTPSISVHLSATGEGSEPMPVVDGCVEHWLVLSAICGVTQR